MSTDRRAFLMKRNVAARFSRVRNGAMLLFEEKRRGARFSEEKLRKRLPLENL
jgi:hypothetical protein